MELHVGQCIQKNEKVFQIVEVDELVFWFTEYAKIIDGFWIATFDKIHGCKESAWNTSVLPTKELYDEAVAKGYTDYFQYYVVDAPTLEEIEERYWDHPDFHIDKEFNPPTYLLYDDLGFGNPNEPHHYCTEGKTDFMRYVRPLSPYGLHGQMGLLKIVAKESKKFHVSTCRIFALVATASGSNYKWIRFEEAQKLPNAPYKLITKIWGRDEGVQMSFGTGASVYH